jgi:nicotinate-nucleotide adenylyltransferase
MNIGLMGGTFNPIHSAHLRIAEEARDICSLDLVYVIPAADPPHKALAGDTPFRLRCEMVSIAISDNPVFKLSDIEGHRAGKSYSIDTICIFRETNPAADLFFIIGSDSFCEIGSWHRYADIFRLCNLIVVERPGFSPADMLEALPVAIRGEFSYTHPSRILEHVSGRSVHFLTGRPLDISSTNIRQLVAEGRSIANLVPPRVESYINDQRIYSACP